MARLTQAATTTPRARRNAKLGSAAAGVLLAIAATLGFSNAAFLGQAENPGNSWATAGAITLTNDKQEAGLHLFNGETLEPFADEPVEGEVEVTYDGDVDAEVFMWVSDTGQSDIDLASRTNVTVYRNEPNGPDSEVYTGRLDGMPTTLTQAKQQNQDAWEVDSNDPDPTARTYTFELSLIPGQELDPGEEGEITGVEFMWEAHLR